jgi:uncharacterized protein
MITLTTTMAVIGECVRSLTSASFSGISRSKDQAKNDRIGMNVFAIIDPVIREVLTGVYESDLGMIAPALGELAGYQAAIGASDVALFGNITPEFSSSVGSRTVAERARSAAFLGVDAILVSGPQAGVPMTMTDLRSAKAAAPDTPVFANTGVQADRLAEILPVADGVIVGTSLKVDGITWNPVDPDRARRFTETAAKVRASLPS